MNETDVMLKYLILIALIQYGLCGSVRNVELEVNKDKIVEVVTVSEDVKDEVKVEDKVEEKVKEDPLTEEESDEDKPGFVPGLRDLAYACEANGKKGYCQAGCGSNSRAIPGANCGPLGKVCCENIFTCGNKTNEYISTFTGGANDLRTVQQCNLVVEAADNSICQIRVDFVQCQLSQPTQQNGGTTPMACNLDSFSVSGVSHPVPTICGACSNQHFYLHINQTNGETAINLVLKLANRLVTSNVDLIDAPNFEFRITQLSCPSKDSSILGYNKYKCSQADFYALAPPGCLQYFTERTGQFKSLTFDTSRPIAANRFLSNLNYAVCFKKVPDANCVKFTSPQFSLADNDPCKDRISCTEMMIGDTNTAPAAAKFRELCGLQFKSTSTVFCPGENPFYLKVRSDATYGATEQGFVINFENPPAAGCPTVI